MSQSFEEIAQRPTSDEKSGRETDGDQHEHSADGTDESAKGLSDDSADPAAGSTEVVDSAITIRPSPDVHDAEHSHHESAPTESHLGASRRVVLTDQNHTDGDRHDGQQISTQANHGPEGGVGPTTNRSGELDVHRQGDQDADDEGGNGGELGLTSRDRSTNFA
jgi:hypothetical protein